jgi:L-alanine-DL-glutamate epimerase-like enolase superfamily enzyme
VKLTAVSSQLERIPLARPYTIAFRTVTAIETVLVVLRDEAGRIGVGTASPERHVTGETNEACQEACAPGRLDWLLGRDVRHLPALCRVLTRELPVTPAARAAVDMALHDLWAQHLGLPLVDALGRAHDALPTSITIGIKSTAEALAEADEYLGRGFHVLKVKVGRSFDEDRERLTKLRERCGPDVLIRADPNQGYDLAQTRALLALAERLDIEFVEQPVPVAATDELRALPEADRARICVDERLLSPADALALVAPPAAAGIFNIKLMKCGGVAPALRIAAIAEDAGVSLMWGCMDESRIGIAAALHAALASPATRYLDLDGSFDLARDLAAPDSGFVVEGGVMAPTGAPGLGVRLVSEG